MITKKTKITPRFVTQRTIRFAGRAIAHPALEQFENETIYVAYDSLMDTTVDIVDHNNSVLVSLESRKVA